MKALLVRVGVDRAYGGWNAPVDEAGHFVYTLIGIHVVREVMPVASVPRDRWRENAHARRANRGATDIVVRAKPEVSGRFDRCVPIGEWRAGAYRVRRDLLRTWGGLSVRDGYIQRSAVPPPGHELADFLQW